MSSSVSLYTLGNQAQAVCDSVTSETAGFPKENVMDFNPDTYWKATGVTDQIFDFDFQAAVTVDTMIILVHNYSLNHSSDTWEVWSSADDAAYTSKGTGTFVGNQTTQLLFNDITQDTKRYWRLSADALAGAFEFSGVFWAQKHTISQGNEWPEPDLETYHNRGGLTAGGRSFVTAINKNKTETFQRTYQLNQADMTTLQNAFNDSKGSLFPLIIQEGSAMSDARFVRFVDNSLNQNQIDYQLYRPTVTFVTQPFISDGETY